MLMNRTAVIFTCLGSFLEWAEYTCYAYLAYHLSQLFFPPNAPYALVIAYMLMACGYIIRPLGAVFFGHIGDRYGRKPALMFSMLLLGLSTTCMGFLPTYSSMGILGAFLLAFCRIIQGFAVGGELNGATIYLMEQARPGFETRASAFVSASIAAGVVTGGFVAMLVSWPGMPVWAWRIPFICAGCLCGISWYFRSSTLVETLDLTLLQKREWPIQTVWRDHKPAFIKMMATGFSVSLFLYLNNVYIVSYLIQVSGWQKHQASFIALIAEAGTIVGILFFARFCDKFPQYAKKLLWTGVFLAPLGTALIFIPNQHPSYWGVLCLWIFFPLINSFMCAPVFKYMFDCFTDQQVRLSGVSVGWTIGAAAASFTPLLAQSSVAQWPILVPIAITLCGSLLMLMSMRRV